MTTPTPMSESHDSVRAIEWTPEGLRLLDQRRLPHEEKHLLLTKAGEVAQAIRDMVVRGAPAIGIAAAYAVVLAARTRSAGEPHGWRCAMLGDLVMLSQARPTAVNLAWAVARMRERLASVPAGADPVPALLEEARAIHAEDVAANRRMGAIGAGHITPGSGVLTHCNTGSLATGGYGTALGVIRSAWSGGRLAAVYADETRPWLQGSRLTAWELGRDGIPASLICEGAAAALMAQGKVQWVVTGADRITANGDVVNKIGTYALAVLARHHGVRFMVAAPTSTLDGATATGAEVPIETRPAAELLGCGGCPVAPQGAGAWNPVFDVTPAALVDVLVTERGALQAPGDHPEALASWLASKTTDSPA